MVGVFEDDPLLDKPDEKSGFMKFLEKVGNIASHGRASTSLWEQMIQAGYLHPYAPPIYTGVKILFFIIGFFMATILILTFSSEEMVFTSKMTN